MSEEQEAEDLRRVAYDAKEEEWQKVKTVWKEANPHDTIHRHKDLYIKGMIDELPWEKITITDEEPPMPLDQWNKMIEEAEKEVSKEVKKPEPDGSYEDEIKYDLEDKDADPKKKTLSYIMRERNQQVKKEHQED